MAHDVPRPERSTGELVKGSDIDLVVVLEDGASDDFTPPSGWGSGSTSSDTSAEPEDQGIVVVGGSAVDTSFGTVEDDTELSNSGWFIPLLVIIVLLLIGAEIFLLKNVFRKEEPAFEDEEEVQEVAEYV